MTHQTPITGASETTYDSDCGIAGQPEIACATLFETCYSYVCNLSVAFAHITELATILEKLLTMDSSRQMVDPSLTRSGGYFRPSSTEVSGRFAQDFSASEVWDVQHKGQGMRNTKHSLQITLAVFAVLIATATFSFPQQLQQNLPEHIRIKNFGRMDDRFYRGGQPEESDYRDLAALGITTVIDLRDTPVSYERRDVEQLGMRYINIPMSDTEYPQTEQVDEFLKLVSDPATGKFFVHCAGGRHRTGVMGAVYRFTLDHWDYDRVYSEMKQYDFYTRWGHGAMKRFVKDYWERIQQTQSAAGRADVAREQPNR